MVEGLEEWTGLVKIVCAEWVGLVKSVCGSGRDWSRVSLGVGVIGQRCLQEQVGSVKSVFGNKWDYTTVPERVGGIDQEQMGMVKIPSGGYTHGAPALRTKPFLTNCIISRILQGFFMVLQ